MIEESQDIPYTSYGEMTILISDILKVEEDELLRQFATRDVEELENALMFLDSYVGFSSIEPSKLNKNLLCLLILLKFDVDDDMCNVLSVLSFNNFIRYNKIIENAFTYASLPIVCSHLNLDFEQGLDLILELANTSLTRYKGYVGTIYQVLNISLATILSQDNNAGSVLSVLNSKSYFNLNLYIRTLDINIISSIRIDIYLSMNEKISFINDMRYSPSLLRLLTYPEFVTRLSGSGLSDFLIPIINDNMSMLIDKIFITHLFGNKPGYDWDRYFEALCIDPNRRMSDILRSQYHYIPLRIVNKIFMYYYFESVPDLIILYDLYASKYSTYNLFNPLTTQVSSSNLPNHIPLPEAFRESIPWFLMLKYIIKDYTNNAQRAIESTYALDRYVLKYKM